MGDGDTLINALIGAVITVVLSFTGFSPLLGGGVAGYLQRGDGMDGVRVGAISGLVATIPFVFVLFVFGGFLFAGPMMGIPGAFSIIALFAIVASLLWTVGLSAVGGFVGVYIATETSI